MDTNERNHHMFMYGTISITHALTLHVPDVVAVHFTTQVQKIVTSNNCTCCIVSNVSTILGNYYYYVVE